MSCYPVCHPQVKAERGVVHSRTLQYYTDSKQLRSGSDGTEMGTPALRITLPPERTLEPYDTLKFRSVR
eukprot:COSAG01_NODE_11374_length_1949_cov_1.553514_1_plen_68_part_10